MRLKEITDRTIYLVKDRTYDCFNESTVSITLANYISAIILAYVKRLTFYNMVYLCIFSLDYEECAHKMMKLNIKPGQEVIFHLTDVETKNNISLFSYLTDI